MSSRAQTLLVPEACHCSRNLRRSRRVGGKIEPPRWRRPGTHAPVRIRLRRFFCGNRPGIDTMVASAEADARLEPAGEPAEELVDFQGAQESAQPANSLPRVVIASVAGNVLEW
jgi:hypothetical protein